MTHGEFCVVNRPVSPGGGATAARYGLPPLVQLINYNDFCLGLLVFLALLRELRMKALSESANHHHQQQQIGTSLSLVLLVVFRDATLWRETVEYLWCSPTVQFTPARIL